MGGQVDICLSCFVFLKDDNSTFLNSQHEKVWTSFIHFKDTRWPKVDTCLPSFVYFWSGADFHGYGLGLLGPTMVHLNATACCDISNFVATVWRRPFVPLHTARSIQKWFSHFRVEELYWPAEPWPQPHLTPLIWNTDCEPELITQHQCWTSLMLLWLNGNKSQQPGSKSGGKPETSRVEAVTAAAG